MNKIKFYNILTGERTDIFISQKSDNLERSTNSKNRTMTRNEACYYAAEAGLTRKKPKVVQQRGTDTSTII